MATSLLNNLILQASRKVFEYRTSASSVGETNFRWKSSNWTDYINRAIRDFLKEKFTQYGAEGFAELFPEYMKISSVLTLTSGAVARPTDAFSVTDLWVSGTSTTFYRVPQKLVAGVKAGIDTAIVPSATNPVFWVEGQFIYTLGVTSGNVLARYVKTHVDLAVITSNDGAGKILLAAGGGYTASTQTLVMVVSPVFASGDENRQIMFVDIIGNAVYFARIASVVSGTTVTLYGDGLPSSDISTLLAVVMSQRDSADVLLNPLWHGEIVDRAVAFAREDSIPTGG